MNTPIDPSVIQQLLATNKERLSKRRIRGLVIIAAGIILFICGNRIHKFDELPRFETPEVKSLLSKNNADFVTKQEFLAVHFASLNNNNASEGCFFLGLICFVIGAHLVWRSTTFGRTTHESLIEYIASQSQ